MILETLCFDEHDLGGAIGTLGGAIGTLGGAIGTEEWEQQDRQS